MCLGPEQTPLTFGSDLSKETNPGFFLLTFFNVVNSCVFFYIFASSSQGIMHQSSLSI